MENKKIKTATIILLVIVMVSLLPWAFAAFTSLFAFDKPGSERDPSVWMIVAPILAYGAIAAGCIIASAILYNKNRPLPALIIIAVPLAAAILYALIMGVYAVTMIR
ncbi:MAG: hypothetical protein JW901_03115 [Dehalococcoidia bacterium]|nr:hypothetical protein [Dehalococcoidia bacterium]